MLISIIAPVYNVEAYIERFIYSIVNQTNKNFKLILVDDQNPDRSIIIAEEILRNYPEVQYQVVRRPKNGGLSAARNSGIEAAKGDYVYFADSDDELELTAVANMHDAISQYPNNAIFLFNAAFKSSSDATFKKWREPGHIPRELSSDAFLTLLYTGKIGAYIWQFLFRRDVFQRERFKEGAVWEDSIIVPQLVSVSNGVVSFDSYFIYRYWIREGSISQSVHPFLDAVVPALDEVERRLYAGSDAGQDRLHGLYIQFRTGITMQLSRECFVRTKHYKRLMEIHHRWGKAIPSSNMRYLKENGKRRSAVYLHLVKRFPSVLYFLYQIKALK